MTKEQVMSITKELEQADRLVIQYSGWHTGILGSKRRYIGIYNNVK
jgi:hypothetical protein